ncbi:putative UPF0613 protein PB24D3.06c [Glarea lozoyensis 74030]|uniref:Putative UPF0613 protein PB24D3.06c n=1 Tax=Glarea lozoyensis (strain ATCC 74030 / MF5533) TaxID=1104152 RepID=H0EKN6_GLAL7|nr:putative UPF0613 protein PB24D3.06c [Glarea lozoyensis 74030]
MVDTEFKGVARPGVSHQFTSKLFAFEHTPQKTSSSAQNIIIFVGGLFDGLHTVPYASRLADALPPSWTLAQAILSSSYTGWGISSLQKDVEELSDCVSYFRSIKPGKIVLMGHSTGCQDVLEYLTGPGHENRKPIDGGLIQAAVSDREAIFTMMDPDTIKSVIFPCPVSAKRFLSLASPNHDGDDDYFSSDLTDDQLMKTFGSLPNSTPICILLSGSDEYVQPDVDPAKLLARWIEIAKSGKGKVDENNSGVIEGATHNLAGNSESVVNDLMKRVLGYWA